MHFRSRRQIARLHSGRVHTLVALTFLAICLVSLVSPLAGPATAGPDFGITECPEFQTWDPDQGKCVLLVEVPTEEEETPPITVDPRDEAEETPSPEIPLDDDTEVISTPTPTQMPPLVPLDETPEPTTPAVARGILQVTKYGCPTGFDFAGANYDELAGACATALDGVGFGVSDGAGQIASATTGDTSPGAFTVYDLPHQQLSVYETNVAAGTASVVYCDRAAGSGQEQASWEPVQAIDHQIFHDFAEALILSCHWFNIPAGGGEGTVTVIITKHLCPELYDASAEDYYDLALNCPDTLDGIDFGVSDGASEIAAGTTGSAFPGGVEITGLPAGATSIYEKDVPAGISSVVFCAGMLPTDNAPADFAKMSQPEANEILDILEPGETLYCSWFNVYDQAAGSATIVITKHICPVDYNAAAEDYYDLALNCQGAGDGIDFGVSDGASEIASGTTGSSGPGEVQFDGVPAGAVAIYEKNIPAGMHSVVFCAGLTPADGGPIDFAKMTQSDPNEIFYVLQEDETLYCSWYNVYDMPDDGGYGIVTIYKWLCPEGFDPHHPGADPAASCTEALNGVTFTLDRPGKDPLVTNTGDSIPGAVQFGGQEVGDYVITETLPPGIASAFVWECTGGSTGGVHPTPLAIGTSLELTIAAGDAIICHWYNVPETDPEMGHLTVIKYACSGPTFVSEVDCEIHEYGVTFDLLTWNGSGWSVVDTRTTSETGTIAWNSLAAGSYVLDEHGDEPCHVTSTFQDGSDHILVKPGEETVVKVYNCTAEGEPPVTGKPPIKYPNTGVAPTATTPAYRGYETP